MSFIDVLQIVLNIQNSILHVKAHFANTNMMFKQKLHFENGLTPCSVFFIKVDGVLRCSRDELLLLR
jgi:hypothetical protein